MAARRLAIVCAGLVAFAVASVAAWSQESPDEPGTRVRIVLEGGVPLTGARVRLFARDHQLHGGPPTMRRALDTRSTRALPSWTDERGTDIEWMVVDGAGLPVVTVLGPPRPLLDPPASVRSGREPWDRGATADLVVDLATTPVTWTPRWRGDGRAAQAFCADADGAVVADTEVVVVGTGERYRAAPDGRAFLITGDPEASGFA